MTSAYAVRFCSACLVAFLSMTACQQRNTDSAGSADTVGAQAQRSKDIAALRTADSAVQHAIDSRDAERTAQFYADSASLLPAAQPIILGREAIRAEWAKLFAIPAFDNTARLTEVEVAASGDLGYTRGTYETLLTAPDGKPVTERGKWVSIWRRQPTGDWRIVVDIYNTDSMPPEHK